MSNEIDTLIVNGKRYVPEEAPHYVEATVRGKLNLEFKDGDLYAEALVLGDSEPSDAYATFYQRFPVGTRVRIYAIESTKPQVT